MNTKTKCNKGDMGMNGDMEIVHMELTYPLISFYLHISFLHKKRNPDFHYYNDIPSNLQ
jgi:hypothetical protein